MDKKVPPEVREGLDLINYFYGFARESDPDQYNLKREFREDVYRSIVFQFHLAIEQILKSFLYEAITKPPRRRTFTKTQNIEYIDHLRSREAIDLAARLHILTKDGHEKLLELNSIRNQCSHNWTLHSFTVRKTSKQGPRQRKYKVEFQGKNLLHPKAMKDAFIPLYGDLYVELFAVYYGTNHRHKYTDKDLAGPPNKKI